MENEIYTSGNIRVTNSRFIVGGDTYAMNGITSVKARMKKKNLFLIYLLAVGAFMVMVSNLFGGTFSIGLLALAIFAGLCYIITVQKKPEYSVVVTSASGEAEAYTSKEKTSVEMIVDAINQAIISRG